MKFQTKGLIVAAVTGATIAIGGFGSAQAAASKDSTITFGWTAWADADFVTHLAQTLIEKRTDHKVKLKMASIGVQYQGVAEGDLDAMMMSWLPDTHASYMKKLGDKIVDLGTIYDGAKLGWAVPDYVPKDKLSSIADLHNKAVVKKLDGRIQGIDPGAGLMQLSEKTMPAYDLGGDYRLVQGSGAAMTAALKRAIDKKQWIVVTLWTPHWAFGKWNLRFLEDPKGTLGGPQHIDVQARKGFKEDYPKVAQMLSNMHLKLSVLQEYMYKARQTSEQEAVDDYIAKHKSKIDGWFNDKVASDS